MSNPKKLSDLKPNTKNPRTITDEKLGMLKKSLDVFGDLGCIVFNEESGLLVGGHQRNKVFQPDTDIIITQTYDPPTRTGTVSEGYFLQAGDRFKYRSVRWNEQTEKAALISANRQGGEWDLAPLAEMIQELDHSKYDMEIVGYDMPEIEDLISTHGKEEEPTEAGCDEDAVPENVEPTAKLGNLYALGNHRLLCGDSTSLDAVNLLMNGEKADMVFTDPPYNIGFSGSMSNTTKNGVMISHVGANQRHEEIKNDKMNEAEFGYFINKILANIILTTSGAWYISFGSQTLDQILGPLRKAKMHWKSIIIWKKNQATLSGKDYKSRYEPIIYGRFNNDFQGERFCLEDIWEFQRTLKNDLHPTMKPIPLIENAINNSSVSGNAVLDLFGGSGSTLIACEKTDRKCFMMELDPHYIDVIIARWEKYSGEKAVLLNDSKILKHPVQQTKDDNYENEPVSVST